ncbi:CopG family transcriptional regulator [Corynebacterium suranareeae]|uniref:CopG family transcriptional regulator n=1 Tax=Corynebacterium suranareeae TaxID=2506452 RepID=A0A160PQV3_9CORY|nr:type II toxin-antitoxin system ParD family antitoxin [Corynebacterium suranareeae]BAU95413.1 CopG family transcriptional regulator [Corynebacterium suranareeae]
MAINISISLDNHFAAFLAEQVALGRYRTESNVVRASLQLLERRETHIAALRDALVDGEASGEAEEFDFDSFIASKTS